MRLLPNGERMSIFECICECGNKKDAPGAYLKSGGIKSCGCYIKRNGSVNWKGTKAYLELHGDA